MFDGIDALAKICVLLLVIAVIAIGSCAYSCEGFPLKVDVSIREKD